MLHQSRLLSDDSPRYIAGELAEEIEARKMDRIPMENCFLPDDLEAQIETFVEHYNHQRDRERLSNVTPADLRRMFRQIF